ncbi:disease resistance protein RPM1-like [Ziziphus jujuba]|uniref:Disease resistance protein RPM1-like n=1 Tax=Ziziphus jujuba TaxID=326968 RepID=A0A6P3ZD33_ZIZJJ|nr:disease resistance protein RPM1-like [Ziziphus jujuba]
MSETAIGYVIDHLVSLLAQEVNFLRGVRSEVLCIKLELEALQCFLKYADMKAETERSDCEAGDGVKAWVKQLREVAFQIEDVIDEYTLQLAQSHRRRGFIAYLHEIGRSVVKLQPRIHIASQIHDIKLAVLNIKERSTGKYGFDSTKEGMSIASHEDEHSWYDPRKGALYLQEADVVGIESPRDELVGWLLDKKLQRTVTSVVGMGGLGKTTLAKKVYDSVKEKFDCHAWIAVSQSYRKEELLKGVIKQFSEGNKEPIPKGIDAMDEDELTQQLRKYLQQKRYVVIFDDVWRVHFWGDIEHALLDNQSGGRIVITTRSMEVANFCRISCLVHIHKLQPLPPEMAWKLFCKKTFQFESDQGHCPADLEKLSRNIVERCNGLPLAIVAIAGLLSTKDKRVNEWRKLHDSLHSELESNPYLTSITRILSLSYNDLPYYLKSCFLYIGMYPENYPIRCSRLIRQWIAEGFVKQKKDKTSEEVALEYLTELIHRSLVQVSCVDLDGKVRTCRIHDLLREVILKKMEDASFGHILSGDKSIFRGGLVTRRLSIVNSSYDVLSSTDQISHVRTILSFNSNGIVLENSVQSTLSKNFKLLKVLDFEDGHVDSVHEDIGNLFHLRYLSLRSTRVSMLPRSIGELANLETLDLKKSFVFELPSEIKRLHKLRHLLAYNHDHAMHYGLSARKGIKLENGIGCLEGLHKLYMLDANASGVDRIKELRKLTQLRRLGIEKLKSEDGKILCWSIEEMKHLESLDVRAISEDNIIDLESISSPPQFLQRLYLYGRLNKLPEWITKLENLSRIEIFWSKLEEDPVKSLKNLHNLLELIITHNAYDGEQLQFEKGVFPKLKILKLRNLSGLRCVVIEEGSLQNLENLCIGPSPKLKEVPFGICHLQKLEMLEFYDMSHEFIMSMHSKGEDYEIVQHVPLLLIHYGCDGGEYKTVRLY